MDTGIIIFAFGSGGAILAFFIKRWIDSIDKSINDLCEQNKNDHEELWERVNKHSHNGSGRVIIT